MNEINIILGAKKVLSVNAIYSSRVMYGPRGVYSTIYKTGEAKRTEEYIKEQIRALNIPKNYPWVNKNTLFKMYINIIFKSGFLLRDVDNCLKLVGDGIFRALELNDSHIVEIQAKKQLFPNASEEKILVKLVEVDKSDIRFDSIPKPHIIWCNDNTPDSLDNFKNLPKRGIKQDMLYKTEDKEKADTKIFFIEKETIDLNTLSKISLDVMENYISAKGFAFIFIIGNDTTWGEKDWSSILEFKKTLDNYSASYSGIKTYILKNKNDFKNIIK